MEIYGNILTEHIQVNKGTALVIGKFDGLHKGHRALLEMLSKAKEEEDLQTAIFTFVRSPMEALDNTKQQYILTAEEKRQYLFEPLTVEGNDFLHFNLHRLIVMSLVIEQSIQCDFFH